MPEIVTTSADTPEFPRVVVVARLPEALDFPFEITPDANEAAAIARLMGARSLRKFRFSGRLTALSGEERGWALDADLGATVIQTCVVSLEPVTTRIDTPVRRRFIAGAPAAPTEAEVLISPEEDDEIEPLGPRIDLGRVALETLALALPAYPRREDADLNRDSAAPPGAEPVTDEETRPFAALSALRDKLDGKS